MSGPNLPSTMVSQSGTEGEPWRRLGVGVHAPLCRSSVHEVQKPKLVKHARILQPLVARLPQKGEQPTGEVEHERGMTKLMGF